MAATAITRKATLHDAMKGGWLEFGEFTLDPASINDNAQGVETAAITGAKVGDIVFAWPEALALGLMPVGAKVTAADEVSVYINNESGGAIDGGSKTWKYMLVHLS